jgi:hypothetical protein
MMALGDFGDVSISGLAILEEHLFPSRLSYQAKPERAMRVRNEVTSSPASTTAITLAGLGMFTLVSPDQSASSTNDAICGGKGECFLLALFRLTFAVLWI